MLLLLAVVVIIVPGGLCTSSKAASGTTCAHKEFLKAGCFKHNATLFSQLLITDLDETHRKFGKDIDWNQFKASLESLACRCREKAHAKKFKYFALGFYGECYAGSNEEELEKVILNPREHASEDCVGGDEIEACSRNHGHVCAGIEDNEYVYEVIEATPDQASTHVPHVVEKSLWPEGNYGIISHDSCPKGWYEFTHCQDTEDSNNQDNIAQFKFALTGKYFKCTGSSITIRYCFKGAEIKTRKGGFWTEGGVHDSAFVIRNVRGDCSVFGADGGSVFIDNEDSGNKNAFGNKGLNGRKYSWYYPKNFLFGKNTHLEFCKIGEGKKGVARAYIEVGEFNQKFGLFVYPRKRCPTLKSPYGLLEGRQQTFFLDNEDTNNKNKVSGEPPAIVNHNSRWSVCEYDPARAIPLVTPRPPDVHAVGEKWPQGNYGIVSHEKCPKGWYEFTHCQDTEDNRNKDNYANFKLVLTAKGLRCAGTSITLRYCFKGPEIKTRSGGFWTKTGKSGAAFVIRNVQGDCSVFGGNGGSVNIDNEDFNNKNAFGNSGLNGKKYSNYYPKGFRFDSNTHLEFCKIGGPNKGVMTDYIEIGEFNQKFGLFVIPGHKCPKLKSPHGILTGSAQNFYLDDEDSSNRNSMSGGSPVIVDRNSRWSVCVYDPAHGVRQ